MFLWHSARSCYSFGTQCAQSSSLLRLCLFSYVIFDLFYTDLIHLFDTGYVLLSLSAVTVSVQISAYRRH